jgi:L-glyceraldehyde 3-phosphate reductase
MALAWTVRLPGVTSALIGASNVEQVRQNVATLDNLDFSPEELDRITSITKNWP